MATLQPDIKFSALRQPRPRTGNYFLDRPVNTGVALALVFILSFFMLPLLGAAGLLIGFGSFGILMWLLLMFNAHQHRHLLATLQQFAADNGFQFAETGSFLSSAAIFQIGRNHKSKHVFTGQLLGYPICFYWHSFTTGSGKHQKTHYYGVVELQLPKAVPHIFLDDRRNNFLGNELLDSFDRDRLIKLEGDFPSHFNVFAAAEYQIEVLTLLNPAFMQKLVDRLNKEEIELFDNSAFVYCDNMPSPTADSIARLLAEAEFLITELKKQLDTFRFTPHPAAPNRAGRSRLKQLLKR